MITKSEVVMVIKRRSFAQARRAAGYTQESLAERLGVDRTTVARWESGEYSPQPWLRPRMAEAFGVSLSALGELVDLDEVEATERAGGGAASLAACEQVPGATREHETVKPGCGAGRGVC
jgi:DNA-binding XRE family transcriptional regulator